MLSKAQKDRIYSRIYRRYSRLAKKLKKNFREVSIDNKLFEDALRFELKKEESRQSINREPSNLKPSRIIERRSPKRKSPLDWIANPSDVRGTHSEKCRCPACEGGFSDPNLIGRIPESDERREARKQIEKDFNDYVEAYERSHTCSICKSSVCHCEEEEENE